MGFSVVHKLNSTAISTHLSKYWRKTGGGGGVESSEVYNSPARFASNTSVAFNGYVL